MGRCSKCDGNAEFDPVTERWWHTGVTCTHPIDPFPAEFVPDEIATGL